MEIEKEWSLDDVADANQVLDYFAHIEYLQAREMKSR
jgi:hypothetical protein